MGYKQQRRRKGVAPIQRTIRTTIDFDVDSATETHESLAILLAGRRAGQADVTYESATASISARVDLQQADMSVDVLDRFHHEFATELMAYVLNRGAMAQGSEGSITYEFGSLAHSMSLPSQQEAGLGYPNSW